jgi:transcriptional regulator with XRE-family HTH domain
MKNNTLKIDELFKAIGQRIRLIRGEKGLSLQDIAERTGFTKSYLSQIENLKREPPISTLAKIAYVLGVDLAFLIPSEIQNIEIPSITIVKKGEGKIGYVQYGKKECLYESLSSHKPDRLMDGYIVKMDAGFVSEPFQHEGQEIVYVLEGTHEFIYDGKTYIFEEGDSYFFESGKTHYVKMSDKTPGKVLVVFAVQKTSVPGALLEENKPLKGKEKK